MPNGSMANKKNKGDVVEKVCECGHIVKAMNESILKNNLIIHKRGNKHKVAMEIKERLSKENKK